MLTSRTLLIVGLLSAGCQLSSESVSEGGSAEASLRCSFDSVAPETMFDVVILAGRVIDPECEFDGLRNIGIKGGTIAVVTEGDISGTETIDATGLVVAPGFIDTHHHGAGNPWGVKASLRDGVTTPMDLELGAINVDPWYAAKEGKWVANYGVAASHEFHRMKAQSTDGRHTGRLRANRKRGRPQPAAHPEPQQQLRMVGSRGALAAPQGPRLQRLV